MKSSGKCPKCDSSKIIADAQAVDLGHGNSQNEMTVATFGRPGALIFKDKRDTTVSAWVCESCGYMELYADNPAVIVRRPPSA